MNACASVRLYGKQGEFVRYRLEDTLLQGTDPRHNQVKSEIHEQFVKLLGF